jgi:hypothetical protein
MHAIGEQSRYVASLLAGSAGGTTSTVPWCAAASPHVRSRKRKVGGSIPPLPTHLVSDLRKLL